MSSRRGWGGRRRCRRNKGSKRARSTKTWSRRSCLRRNGPFTENSQGALHLPKEGRNKISQTKQMSRAIDDHPQCVILLGALKGNFNISSFRTRVNKSHIECEKTDNPWRLDSDRSFRTHDIAPPDPVCREHFLKVGFCGGNSTSVHVRVRRIRNKNWISGLVHIPKA
ncbi:MAG: hypothetical protein GHCLOJNM_03204 [bacterium]|nr:hypothetical protein [bacterium]